jgi:ankyrin repeat protein
MAPRCDLHGYWKSTIWGELQKLLELDLEDLIFSRDRREKEQGWPFEITPCNFHEDNARLFIIHHLGRTILEASVHGFVKLIKHIWPRGSDSDVAPACLDEALVEACSHRNKEMIEFLLARGANVNAWAYHTRIGPGEVGTDYCSHTSPLIAAARRGHIYNLNLLLRSGAEVHEHHRSHEGGFDGNALVAACLPAVIKTGWGAVGYLKCVKLLVENGADAGADCSRTRDGRSLLQTIAGSGNTELAQILLDAGAQADLECVLAAVTHKDADFLRWLFECDSDAWRATDYETISALQTAVLFNFDASTQKRLEASTGIAHEILLRDAICHGSTATALTLLNSVADPNDIADEGIYRTALQKACSGKALHTHLAFLLARGADIDLIVDRPGACPTALHAAIEVENVSSAFLLLQHGAHVSSDARTYAARRGVPKKLARLLDMDVVDRVAGAREACAAFLETDACADEGVLDGSDWDRLSPWDGSCLSDVGGSGSDGCPSAGGMGDY